VLLVAGAGAVAFSAGSEGPGPSAVGNPQESELSGVTSAETIAKTPATARDSATAPTASSFPTSKPLEAVSSEDLPEAVDEPEDQPSTHGRRRSSRRAPTPAKKKSKLPDLDNPYQ
jgi:hypothetical protein